jgi:metal-responsive CopG/Arc/MetJ family transcriptional regulator
MKEVILRGMKVAISLPDPIFRAADRAAKQMRVPRSRFYARAIEAYLKQTSAQEVTKRLDAVYKDDATEPDPFLKAAARATLRRSRW